VTEAPKTPTKNNPPNLVQIPMLGKYSSDFAVGKKLGIVLFMMTIISRFPIS
jgi:hypothetical protein